MRHHSPLKNHFPPDPGGTENPESGASKDWACLASVLATALKIHANPPTMRSHSISNSILALFAASSLTSAQTAGPVSFDWFEYSGKDPSLAAEAGAGKFHNTILAGFYPDPSICRMGDDFHLANSTFAHFPGLPIFHSKDLVNWKLIGHAIHRPEQLNFDGIDVSAGLWAPTIRFHDGKFYMICTHQYHEENFLVTADHPAGQWSDPVMLGFKDCDPSLFFDDDGRVWVVTSDNPEGEPRYKEHKAVRLQEYDPTTAKMIGPRKVVVNGGVDISKKPRYVEGPHIVRIPFKTKQLIGLWPVDLNPIKMPSCATFVRRRLNSRH
jgi:xylan 1,4-beta-xylosidase